VVIKLFGVAGDSMSMVYDLRWVNAVLGAVTVVLAFLLTRRVANDPIAWGCAVIVAFDPFVLRNNSRLFLETPGTAAVLAGLLVLVATLSSSRPQRTGQFVAAGLLLGYGVLTKDALAMYAVVPIMLAVSWRHTVAPRNAGITLAAAATPYLLYIAFLGAQNVLDNWLHAKTTGLARMVGLIQTTGFNAPDAPSLFSRLVDQVGQFGTSYVLLIACPVVGAFTALSQRSDRRLIGLTAVSMGLFGLYAAAFGTFEEHYGYGVMIASITALAVSTAELLERRPDLRAPALWVGAFFLALTVTLGVRAQLTTDNGFQQARAWVAANLPPTSLCHEQHRSVGL
jgi:4-amino-4-deoxy-L-arabinose transferase-like glycosyltransferase